MQTVPRQKFEAQPQVSLRRATRPKVGAHAAAQRAINGSWSSQYRPPDGGGRKWQVKAKRCQALAKYIAGFPSCYQSLDTLTRELNKSLVGNFHWSRRTVAHTLRHLRSLGVIGRAGYRFRRGGRIRTVHPERLGPRILHSETAESCTQENIASQNIETTGPIDSPKPPRRDFGRVSLKPNPQSTAKPEPKKPFEKVALEILDAFTPRYEPEMASALFHWIYTRLQKRKHAPPIQHIKAYFFAAAENFYDQHTCEPGDVGWLMNGHNIEEAGFGIQFCGEHNKWESAKYPCHKRAA